MEKQNGLAIIFLLLLSCATPEMPQVIFDNGAIFDVEIAETREEQTNGLMYREFLPEYQGMLFIFNNTAPRSFWMKNTLIPLDMIFLDENFKVVEIKSSVQPCKEEKCPTYPSVPAMYVLELNAGQVVENKISIGSVMLRK